MMCTIVYTFLVFHVTIITCTDVATVGCWPDNVIPFRISLGFKEKQINLIREAIGEFHRSTCLRWIDEDKVPYNATADVVFQKVPQPLVCRADKGFLSNSAEVVTAIRLGDSCFEKKVLVHEMMHVLGFSHEHQRADRDCYVEINRQYLNFDGVALHFAKVRQEPWLERFPYDKYSNMHYSTSYAMRTLNQSLGPYHYELQVNIALYAYHVPRVGYKGCGLYWRSYSNEPLGQNDGTLSEYDIWKIKYKFCGFPHYCDVFPDICDLNELLEKKCTKLN